MLSFNPDFWSFHFVKMYQQYHSTICVLWNNKIAGCLVIYWRNTVSASSWEASKWLVSVSGLGDSIWVASLKPPPAKIVRSVDVCRMSGKDDVSVVYFRMGYGFLFGRQGDDPTFNHSPDWLETLVHLFLVPCLIEVSYLSVSMRLKASPACRRDLIKLSAKSPNIAACWA